MGYKIKCITLFDVTKSGVLHRSKPLDMDDEEWISKRNTQCNLDTILQTISLRSLPELCNDPVLLVDTHDKFGRVYKNSKKNKLSFWKFEFFIQDTAPFYDGINQMGALYNDCQGVPMIKCKSMISNVPNYLDTTFEFCNIYFEVIGYEN